MSGIAQDVRFAFRGLRKSPGFTLVAALTLALGIGANSAMFSLAYNTLVTPLPFDDPHELVMVGETPPKQTGRSRVAFLNFVDWRDQSHTFDSMAAVTGSAVTIQTPDGTPEEIRSQSVTVDFFRVFRVRPILAVRLRMPM
jgi:hypothetical protein